MIVLDLNSFTSVLKLQQLRFVVLKGSSKHWMRRTAVTVGCPFAVAHNVAAVVFGSYMPFRNGGSLCSSAKFIKTKPRDVCFKFGQQSF